MKPPSPALWEQVLDNLLENALKYSSLNQLVLIQVKDAGEVIQLSVIDQGIGIPTKDVQHLFEPFFRAEETRQRGIVGVGLGLAITARIVAAFGGSIWAESHYGSGSTFTISLPGIQNYEIKFRGTDTVAPCVISFQIELNFSTVARNGCGEYTNLCRLLYETHRSIGKKRIHASCVEAIDLAGPIDVIKRVGICAKDFPIRHINRIWSRERRAIAR